MRKAYAAIAALILVNGVALYYLSLVTPLSNEMPTATPTPTFVGASATPTMIPTDTPKMTPSFTNTPTSTPTPHLGFMPVVLRDWPVTPKSTPVWSGSAP